MTGDEHNCDGEHEHHLEKVLLQLTPSGLRLNVLGLIFRIQEALSAEDYSEAADLTDRAMQMLSAAYLGRFDLLDQGYETALVEQLQKELDDPEALAALNKEENGE